MLSNTEHNLSTPVSTWQCSAIDQSNTLKNKSFIDEHYNIVDGPSLNIRTKYQQLFELKCEPNLTGEKSINNKNFLVKIDDDYKLITNCQYLNKENLEKVIKVYYPNSELEIFPLANNINLLSSYICNTNSFLNNNDIVLSKFIDHFNKFDEIIGYLKNFDSSCRFTNTLQNITKLEPESESNVKINQLGYLKDLRHTISDTSSTYFDNIVGITPYSGNIIGGIDDENYECSFSNYMSLDNFSESLIDFHKDYHIYFNNQFNNMIMLEASVDFIGSNNKIKKIFPEIIFVAKERLSKDCYNEVYNLSKDIFVNVEDIKTKLNKILHDKVIDSKLSIDEIKFLIKKYFQIDTNTDHCIKFTNIWEIISSELRVSESYVNYIKRQLPIILQDLGLNKKRLSDGIYWYGLVHKPLDSIKPLDEYKNVKLKDEPIPVEQFKSTYEKYIIDRDLDLKSVISSYLPNLINKEQQLNKTVNNTDNEVVNENKETTLVEPAKRKTKTKGKKQTQNNTVVEQYSASNELSKLVTPTKPKSNKKL